MRRLILLLTALLTVAVSGTAVAAQATREKPRSGVAAKAQRGLVGTAAGYLGLTQTQVRAQVRSGKSLAQIATAEGKSVDGLKVAVLEAFTAKVAAAEAAGRIDAATAERLLARAPAIVERLVMRTPTARADRVRLRGGMLKVAAEYVGFTPKQLVYELRSGTSLAQIATARGKSVAGLEAAILAAFTAKIDTAVAAGRLDAAHAPRLLERAPAHIARIVNRTRG